MTTAAKLSILDAARILDKLLKYSFANSHLGCTPVEALFKNMKSEQNNNCKFPLRNSFNYILI